MKKFAQDAQWHEGSSYTSPLIRSGFEAANWPVFRRNASDKTESISGFVYESLTQRHDFRLKLICDSGGRSTSSIASEKVQ